MASYLCNRHISHLEDDTLVCPPTVEVLEATGLFSIDEYIRRRRSTANTFMVSCDIYTKCISSHRADRNISRIVWWELQSLPPSLDLLYLVFLSRRAKISNSDH